MTFVRVVVIHSCASGFKQLTMSNQEWDGLAHGDSLSNGGDDSFYEVQNTFSRNRADSQWTFRQVGLVVRQVVQQVAFVGHM